MYNINKDSEGFYYDAVGYCIPTIYRACKTFTLHVLKVSYVQKHVYSLCVKHLMLTAYALYIYNQSSMLKYETIRNPEVLYIRARIL